MRKVLRDGAAFTLITTAFTTAVLGYGVATQTLFHAFSQLGHNACKKIDRFFEG